MEADGLIQLLLIIFHFWQPRLEVLTVICCIHPVSIILR